QPAVVADTQRTTPAVPPPQPIQVVAARVIVREPRHKLIVGPRIMPACGWKHRTILPDLDRDPLSPDLSCCSSSAVGNPPGLSTGRRLFPRARGRGPPSSP